MANFLLVRHGTTNWVEGQILHGIIDVPLNKKGKLQAEETARALRGCGAKKLYTSSLSRCVQTTRVIGSEISCNPTSMDSLVELDFGWLEGKHLRDHDNGEYGKLLEFIDHNISNIIRIISGESKKKLNQRVLRGWNTILAENPKGTSIVVAHSAVFNSILFHYFGKAHLNSDTYYHLNPCSITEISIDASNRAELIRLNDRSHLSGENL